MAWSGSNQTDPTLFRIDGVTYKLFNEYTGAQEIESTLLSMRSNGVEPWRIHYPYVKQKYKEFCKTYKACAVCKKVLNYENMFEFVNSFYCEEHKDERDYKKRNWVESQNDAFLKKYGVKRPAQHKDVMNKMKQTTLERYGVESYFQTEECREAFVKKYGDVNTSQLDFVKRKKAETSLKNYGFKSPLQSPEIKERIRKTNLEKYGTEIPTQNPEIYKKVIKTNLERYGCKIPSQNPEVYKKTIETNLKKYGTEHVFQSEEVKELSKKTCRKKYGVDYVGQAKSTRQKMKNTCLEKYGTSFASQKNISNFDDLNENFIRKEFIENGLFLISEFTDYFNVGHTTAVRYKEIFNITESNKTEKYKTQELIFKSIESENKILNNRSLGMELDIYLPDQKLAVEYDGLIFHSQGTSKYSMLNTPDFDKNYHLNKTELCNQNGIQLFHIFEGENLDLWLSMINNKLGLSKRIYARKCIIKELNNKETKDFLNENHIQGFCAAKINLGLFYNNELVQLMTFSKPRFNKKYEYELIRLCSTKNTTVVGGPSKLLNYFKKVYKPKSIISYANRRFSNGSIYEILGFKLINKTEPNYFYFKIKDLKLESRNKYQKHKLSKLLEKFDPNLSETQNMFNNEYRRIFDCGNLVYELKLDV